MKILLLKPFLVAKSNGGEISMIERLKLLKSWGADVQIHIAVPEYSREKSEEFLKEMKTPLVGNEYTIDGLKCQVQFSDSFHPNELTRQSLMEEYFLGILSREKPDLVWAHYTDFFAVTSAIRWNRDRTWVILTDDEYPRQIELNQYPTIAMAYLNIQTIVVASRFMRESVRAVLPWTKVLQIPNPVESLKDSPVDRKEKKFWVFVNPTRVKGVEFMIELAREQPEEKFLFVGNWATEMPQALPANVSVLPRQNGLKKVFSEAKGLLMPSVWQEAFGRLVLEAMATGVPVIASNRGSLPETVGSGGFSIPLEIPEWILAMKDVKANDQKMVEKGYSRVRDYRAQTSKRLDALRRLLTNKFQLLQG